MDAELYIDNLEDTIACEDDNMIGIELPSSVAGEYITVQINGDRHGSGESITVSTESARTNLGAFVEPNDDLVTGIWLHDELSDEFDVYDEDEVRALYIACDDEVASVLIRYQREDWDDRIKRDKSDADAQD